MGPIVSTVYGPVEGISADGVDAFRGIPYAASPTGPRRFREPQPPEPWTEVRAAKAFGPTPPKPPYPEQIGEILSEVAVPGDDWLSVNVWRPSRSDGAAPVMVWIHGGAFVNGNSAIDVYDGARFARDGIVLVSLNYRLGVDGFAYLPDAPANRGLLDQVAALEWVRDNIAGFGGDPSNVTVFGESAGAMSITCLLAMPRARGLFVRAITQSGAAQAAAEPSDAALVAKLLGEAIGSDATAAAFAELPVERLVEAQRAVSAELQLAPDRARFGASIVAAGMPLVPVIDGDVLPEHPMAAFAAGVGTDVALLTGTTTEEYRLFLVPTGVAGFLTDELLVAFAAQRGIAADVVERYRADMPGATPGDLLCALITDAFFRLPALAVVGARSARSGRTWLYEFGWRSGVPGLGACHAMEIPFVFDNLDCSHSLTGSQPPQALADTVHAAWVAFAKSGDPGWPAQDGTLPVMTFDGDGARLVHDPRSAQRTIWASA